jgi:hypothetical protein
LDGEGRTPVGHRNGSRDCPPPESFKE